MAKKYVVPSWSLYFVSLKSATCSVETTASVVVGYISARDERRLQRGKHTKEKRRADERKSNGGLLNTKDRKGLGRAPAA